MSSPSGIKSTDRAAITTLTPTGQISKSPSSANVAIFEGFFDFLSWRVMQGDDRPGCDTVVLNSTANINQAKEYIAAHCGEELTLDAMSDIFAMNPTYFYSNNGRERGEGYVSTI